MKKNIILITVSIIAMVLLNSYKIQILEKQTAEPVFMILEVILIIVSVILIYSICTNKEITVKKTFFHIIPIYFLLFLIFMPVFTSHDESWHWYRVYDISNGNFLTKKEDNIPVATMPKSIDEISLEKFRNGITYEDLKDMFNTYLDKDNTKRYELLTTAIFSPIQYLPQAIGVCISKIITQKPVIMAYGGRIVNTLISFGILLLAIKKIPFGKKILFACMCLPIAIEGFTSLSGDAITISISMLLTSYVLNLAYKKDNVIEKKEKIILTVLCIIISLCKIVYLPLVFLVLLIPNEKFSKKENILKILLISLCVIINISWLSYASNNLSTRGDGEYNTNIIFKSPLAYIEKMIYTVDNQTNSYVLSLFGEKIGDCELIEIGHIVTYVNLIILVATIILSNDTKDKFNKRQIFIILTITVMTVGLIFTSLFIQWTRTEANYIEGIQGRYFLPILPIVAILISSIIKIKSEYKEENVIKFLSVVQIISLLYTITSIIIENL